MSGCIACLEKDDRYPHTCNKGANSMTEREQVMIMKLVDNNEGRPDDLTGCAVLCSNVPCHLCPANNDQKITLGEIRAMDPRKSKSDKPEVTPTDDQPSTHGHSEGYVCNCERDYDTSDGHALDCAIHSGNTQDNMIEGVTKPSHYMLFDDIEAIEVIARSMTREQFKGYCLGNILKYRLRAGKKSELAYLEKDMAKAGFYGELYEKHKDKCYDA
uniref:Nucleotide kinase n=1 Tax=Yersinia phage vB_YenP_WW2 TaxID=2973654 RepID=A0AAT9SCM0_9CAUD